MLTVAIVDDDSRKMQRLMGVVRSTSCGDKIRMSHFTSASDFIESARVIFYDLLILDLHIPFHLGGESNDDNAIRLIRRISPAEFSNPPGVIIGITAMKDLYASRRIEFSGNMMLIDYSQLDGIWESQFRMLVEYLTHYRARVLGLPRNRRSVDCLFVTALLKPEFERLKMLGRNWREDHEQHDPFSIFIGEFEVNGTVMNSVISSAPAMGMAPTTSLVTNLLGRYNPRVAAMTGICAGIDASVEIGDCIFAEETWDYQSGKWVDGEEGGAPVFKPDVKGIPVSGRVKRIADDLSMNNAVLEGVASGWSADRPTRGLKLHVGPLGSGGAVVQSAEIIAMVKAQKRKALGIDMEAFGFMYSMRNQPDSDREYFCVKSVSDRADARKADSFQSCCSFYSASIALRIASTLISGK